MTNERPGLGNCISITPRVMTLGHSPLTRYDEHRGKYSARTHSRMAILESGKDSVTQIYSIKATGSRSGHVSSPGCTLGSNYSPLLAPDPWCQATHAARARGESFPNTCYHNLATQSSSSDITFRHHLNSITNVKAFYCSILSIFQ